MLTLRRTLSVAIVATIAVLACSSDAQAQYPVAVQPVVPAVVGYTAERRGLFRRRVVYRPVVAPVAAPVVPVAPVAPAAPVVSVARPVVSAPVVTVARPVLTTPVVAAPVVVARPVVAPVTVARPVVVAPVRAYYAPPVVPLINGF